jgi:hypothetical protein
MEYGNKAISRGNGKVVDLLDQVEQVDLTDQVV